MPYQILCKMYRKFDFTGSTFQVSLEESVDIMSADLEDYLIGPLRPSHCARKWWSHGGCLGASLVDLLDLAESVIYSVEFDFVVVLSTSQTLT